MGEKIYEKSVQLRNLINQYLILNIRLNHDYV